MERIKKQTLPDFEKKTDVRKIILDIAFYLFLLIFIAALGYSFIFSNLTQISKIEVSGTEELDPEDIKTATARNISGKYLGMIPRNNYIFVRKESVGFFLENEFRKIETLEVNKIFPNSLSLKIKERKSLIIWCSGGPCYIVDGRGSAFSGIYLDSKEARENNLIKLIDESAQPVVIGEAIIDSKHLEYLLGLREILKKEAMIEIQDEFFTRSRVAEELKVKTTSGWDIYFSSSFPADDPIAMMKIFLDQKIPPQEISNLEYIDLRVEGKVYYKMKNIPPQEEQNKEAETDNDPAEKDKEKKDKH